MVSDRIVPGVMVSKELTHDLNPHQVPQHRIDRDHLEQQAHPSHEDQNIVAGKVIQEVLEDKDPV